MTVLGQGTVLEILVDVMHEGLSWDTVSKTPVAPPGPYAVGSWRLGRLFVPGSEVTWGPGRKEQGSE